MKCWSYSNQGAQAELVISLATIKLKGSWTNERITLKETECIKDYSNPRSGNCKDRDCRFASQISQEPSRIIPSRAGVQGGKFWETDQSQPSSNNPSSHEKVLLQEVWRQTKKRLILVLKAQYQSTTLQLCFFIFNFNWR